MALAKSDPQIVAKGVIFDFVKTPVKLMIKYGVHAMNQSEIVIKATLANLHSADVAAFSDDLNEATFIFFACSLMFFSWADTAFKMKKYE